MATAAVDMDRAAADNRVMWRGQPGHYEVFFLTLYDPGTCTGFWLRYTLDAPLAGHGSPHAELWFCRGDARAPARTFGIHRRYPIESVRVRHSPPSLHIADASFAHESADVGVASDTVRLQGALRGHGHTASWDLHFPRAPRTHRHLPGGLYQPLFDFVETLVLSPNLSVAVSGTIEVDGERYQLHGVPGGQSHLWGRKHAYGWGWAHCNAFETVGGTTLDAPSPAVMEALTVRMRRGPVVVPMTMLSVYPDGLDGEELAFKEWLQLPLSRGEYRTGHYALQARSATVRAEAVLSCRADDMVRCEYVDPDGAPAYCHFAPTGSCNLTLWRRAWPGARWRLWQQLSTRYGAQFEWAGRAGDSTVKKRHLLIEE